MSTFFPSFNLCYHIITCRNDSVFNPFRSLTFPTLPQYSPLSFAKPQQNGHGRDRSRAQETGNRHGHPQYHSNNKVDAAPSQQEEPSLSSPSTIQKSHPRGKISEALPHIRYFAPDKRPRILLGPWFDSYLFPWGLANEDVHRVRLHSLSSSSVQVMWTCRSRA